MADGGVIRPADTGEPQAQAEGFEVNHPVLQDEAVRERELPGRLGTPEAADAISPKGSLLHTVIARSRLVIWLPPLIALVIAAAAWEYYAYHSTAVIPTLGSIWHSLTSDPQHQYWRGFKATMGEVAVGAGSGITIAFLLAVLLAEVRIIERAVMPTVVIMMVTPMVAIAPALVIAFGFGSTPKYIIAGLLLFPPMLINSLAGMRNVDDKALDFFVTLDANRWETFRHLRLPSSLPFVFVGLRVALPISVVGATVAEIAAPGSQAGLGAIIAAGEEASNLPVMWTSIFLLCVMGVAMMGVWFILRRRILWWDNEAALARRGS